MVLDLLTSTIISICSCVTGVAAVIALIVALNKKAKAPEEEQNSRITRLEEDVRNIYVKLKSDLERLNNLEEGDEVTQKAILALLRHSINGNDIDSLKRARDELESHLTARLHSNV